MRRRKLLASASQTVHVKEDRRKRREAHMDSMELVRFDSKASRPLHGPARPSQRLFYSELAGPARNAILRARQLLISQQHGDGAWVGRQASDVSLASQFIFLLACTERADTELAKQAAATILDEQLPDGGWAAARRDGADISTSVQAYFALKLAGCDPTDERLSRARQVIRDLDGADVADVATRAYLALFGQIDYGCCQPVCPESLLVNALDSRRIAPRSIVWSHRCVYPVGIERGVRELFVKRPHDWRPIVSTDRRSKLGVFLNSVVATTGRMCECRGWTPLRRRGLDVAEALVLVQVDARRVGELEFEELVWHMLALRATGHGPNTAAWQSCEARLNLLVQTYDESDSISPVFSRAPFADTVMALQSLAASGLAPASPAVAAAIESLQRMRRSSSVVLSTCELSRLIELIGERYEGEPDCGDALPPEIAVAGVEPWRSRRMKCHHTAGQTRIRRIAESLIEPLLHNQNRDGGWGTHLDTSRLCKASQSDATGSVLIALESFNSKKLRTAKSRAVSYLRSSQNADGSWADATNTPSLFATSLAIRGLLAAGLTLDEDAIAAGINWIIVHQQSTGGWNVASDEHCERQASVSQTARALLALTAAGKAHHAAARRAARFLIDSQDNDGHWNETEHTIYEAVSGRWLRNELHSTAWPLLALSRWSVAAASAQPEATDEMSFRLVGVAADD
jgi:squalene-hopene/tetraprenyl-beta-curcumene cyclase